MGSVVYADVLFLIDFSMDFLTFYIVSRVLKQKIRLIRMCSASAMGGIYSVISLGIDISPFLGLLFDIFVCFVMCMTAFLEKSRRRMRRMPFYTLIYFTVSAMLGGIMTAIFGFLNHSIVIENGGRDDLSLWVFGFVAIISGLATMFGSNLIGHSSRAKFGCLKVRLGKREMSFEAMSDSGNLLKDPIGGKDVVVLDKRRARQLIPEVIDNDLACLPMSIAKTVRLIPIRTAAGEGILTAFMPDEVTLCYDGTEKNIDVLVAVSREELEGNRVEAIVSSDYFT